MTAPNHDALERPAEAIPLPIPLRFRWLKRFLVGVAVVLVVLVGLRWWWDVVAHRELQAEIDRIQAAGEPLFPSDFDSPYVPDEQNAALVIEEAVAASTGQGADLLDLVHDAERWDNPLKRILNAVQWTKNRGDLRKIIRDNRQALALMRKARSLGTADWNVRIRSPAIQAALWDLPQQRDLAKLASGAAVDAHRRGDDATAVKRIRDVLALAELTQQRPELIPHLVAIAEAAMAVDAAEDVAPCLLLAPEAASTRRTGEPASRPHVRALIRALLDEASMQASLIEAMYCERMLHFDMLHEWAGRTVEGAAMPSTRQRLETLVLGPVYKLELARGLRHLSQLAEAVREADWPAVESRLPVVEAPNEALRRVTKKLSALLLPELDRAIELHFRLLAVRRMAAIALAIRMYEVDHGDRPENLADLVPAYLPAVPADPFAASGRPIAYRPEADPPVLYSVNRDGVDENGAYGLTSGGYVDYDAADVPFFLDGDRPRGD